MTRAAINLDRFASGEAAKPPVGATAGGLAPPKAVTAAVPVKMDSLKSIPGDEVPLFTGDLQLMLGTPRRAGSRLLKLPDALQKAIERLILDHARSVSTGGKSVTLYTIEDATNLADDEAGLSPDARNQVQLKRIDLATLIETPKRAASLPDAEQALYADENDDDDENQGRPGPTEGDRS